jgi:transporter family-2 protein
MKQLIPSILALIAGALMAFQGSLNSALSKITGLLESTFIVHLTGTITVVLLLFVGQFGKGKLMNAIHAPWYTWLGGILGVAIIYTVAASIPKLGVATATTFIILAQVSTALLIDHLGLFGLEKTAFTWLKFLGALLLAVGARLILG